MSCKTKRLKKSSNDIVEFSNAQIQYLSNKCDFCVSPFSPGSAEAQVSEVK